MPAQKMWPKGETARALAADEKNMVSVVLEDGLKEMSETEPAADKVLEAKSGLDKLVAGKKDEGEPLTILPEGALGTPEEAGEMTAEEQADIEAEERTSEE